MKKFTVLLTVILFINTVKAQFTCGDSLLDVRDGQKYATVLIGEQCWMAENLNIGTMISSTTGGQLQTDNDTIEKYCYDNNTANCDIYGGLYEWDEMMQFNPTDNDTTGTTQGICPAGWHIPTHHEWTTLERAICTSGTCAPDFPYDFTTYGWQGTDEGGKLKETGTIHWTSPNTGATNESGFTALPGASRGYSDGSFDYLGNYATFWSATERAASNAWYRYLHYINADVCRYDHSKTNGRSVRCVKDIDPLTSLTISPQYGSISIYPNPNDGIFNLVIESGKKEEFALEITNINGQVIIRKGFKPLTKIIYQIDLSKYPKGVYLVKIMSNKINRTEKIILE